MYRTLALATLLAPLAACDGLDTPPRQPWSPDFDPLAVTVAPDDLPLPPAECGRVTRWRYTYDARGLRTRAARHTDERMPDRIEERTYDDAGRIVRAQADWEGGYVDVTLERDPDGRIVRRVVDASEPSMRSTAEIVERGETREVIRYSGAVLLLEPFDPITERKWDPFVREAVHDPLIDGDAMIMALVRRIEAGEDIDPLFDPFDVIETRTFDAYGEPLRTEWDLDGDGAPEQIREWNRADPRVNFGAIVLDDYDADGVIDHRTENITDDYGSLIREVKSTGGQVYSDRTLTYDADDVSQILVGETLRLISAEGVESERVTTYAVEDRAHITRIDEDGDGAVDHITTIWRRDDGQRVLKQEDGKADGEVDWQRRHVYDVDGREVYSQRDRDVDGEVDLRWDYGWSAGGRLLHAVSTEPGSARCGGLRR